MMIWACSSSPTKYEVINYAIENKGIIELAEDIKIDKESKGYTIWKPKRQVYGALVFFHSNRDTTSVNTLQKIALNKNLAIIYLSSGNRLDFYFTDEILQEINSLLIKACNENGIPKNNLLYCGMSLEGTRAIRLAIFQNRNPELSLIKPRGLAICDSPLDMVRFYKECQKAYNLNYNSAASNEGYWVSNYLYTNLGGHPDTSTKAYTNYSPYSYRNDTESNIKYLKETPVRAYTEPDINWWIENRRKDYYGMNSIDLSSMINALKKLENKHSELIITKDKGYLPDGSKHPHSWSIVDENELIEWFIKLK